MQRSEASCCLQGCCARQLGLAVACVSQVFQASALVLADLRVLKDPAFLAVSMTAQLWVPLLEVPERDLLRWMQEKQAAGYR